MIMWILMWDVEEITIPGSVTGAIIICVLSSC